MASPCTSQNWGKKKHLLPTPCHPSLVQTSLIVGNEKRQKKRKTKSAHMAPKILKSHGQTKLDPMLFFVKQKLGI